jgi:hypothetical protein
VHEHAPAASTLGRNDRSCSSEMTHGPDRLRTLVAGDGCRCVGSGPARRPRCCASSRRAR